MRRELQFALRLLLLFVITVRPPVPEGAARSSYVRSVPNGVRTGWTNDWRAAASGVNLPTDRQADREGSVTTSRRIHHRRQHKRPC
jgi:hypothetical protein